MLHAGTHAATTAAALPKASATYEDTQDAAQHRHGAEAHSVSNGFSSAAATTERKQCQQRDYLRPNDSTEADKTRRVPCPPSRALPLWPMAAELTSPSPSSIANCTDPISQRKSCSRSGEAACELQSLYMHDDEDRPSTASAEASSEHESQPQAGIEVQGQPDAPETAVSQASIQPEAQSECNNHASDTQAQAAIELQGQPDAPNTAVSQASTQPEDRKNLQRPHELIGRELFITASMLNHSCEPNCLVVREAGHARIVTKAPIEVSPHPDCSCRMSRYLSWLQCIL